MSPSDESYTGWRRFGIVGPLPHYRIADVQNDLDLAKKILASIRDREGLKPEAVQIEGYDATFVARHVERLTDAGFIDHDGKHRALSDMVPLIKVRDLSLSGHQLLAAMENDTVWGQIKGALSPKELAALPLKGIAKLAGDVAMKIAAGKLGL